MRSVIPALVLLCALPALAQEPGGNLAPAGERLTQIVPGGVTILPTGRLLTPYGKQIVVAPHPYGLALSPDGQTLVASSNGVGPFALTVVSGPDAVEPVVTTISSAQEPDFRSTYQGVAVAPDGETLYAAGGNDGRVHVFDRQSRRRLAVIGLNGDGWADSIPAQMALSRDGRTLLVVDQGNYRLAVIDTATQTVTGSVKTGRTPFAVAFSPDERAAYVANIGLFEYRPIERRPGKDERGLPSPPFGYPSLETLLGTVLDERNVPALGAFDVPEAYSVWGFDLADRAQPRFLFSTTTGIPISYTGDEDEEKQGQDVVGGSAPCALVVSERFVYVSNANNDTIQALDRQTGAIASTISLSDLLPRLLGPGLTPASRRSLRGISPFGLALSPDGTRLYAALAGFNAVAVIDLTRTKNQVLGMIPAGWYAARVAVSPDGRRLYVTSGKGYGSGPNGGVNFVPGPEGTNIGRLMKGTISLMDVPADSQLPALTRQVLENNGVAAAPAVPAFLPPVRHVLFITKENRTFDEMFGALPGVRGDATLARFGTPRPISGLGTNDPILVAPNHIALAQRYGISDNFYVDSDHSADGHRWLAGVAPNHWTESIVSAGYGGQMSYRDPTTAPGRRILFGSNSSVMPEDYGEAGTLWHHLARHGMGFRNWGEGFEFAGISEDAGLKPTGARLPINIPMPLPLFKNTSRAYPGYNTNIPDQYRADVFLREFGERYESGAEPLPRYLYMHLPNDHEAGPRPADGYPVRASFVADNDLALGRIVQHLSRSRFWEQFAIIVTEDDAQSGVDSVDAHRSLLMVISPWAKRGYVSRRHADISSIHHGVFDLLGVPPLSLYDALASDLSDFWTDTPDFTPYSVLGIDPRLFDPDKAKDPLDPEYRNVRASAPLDDPAQVEQLRRANGLDK